MTTKKSLFYRTTKIVATGQGTVLFLGLMLWGSALRVEASDPASPEVASTRSAFLKIIDRPRVPLSPEVRLISQTNGLEEFHFGFAADSEQKVPGIGVKQAGKNGRLPVVIVLHGTGGNKESELGLLRTIAGKGFLAVAIDGRYHGERTREGKGTAEYTAAIERAFSTGKEHPFYYDTVWDVMRLVDYLESRDDVDSRRIGLTGFSKGGIETYLAAAVDPRIAVAIPCIGVQSFGWALEHEAWKSRIGTIQKAFDAAAKAEGVAAPGKEFVRKFYDRVTPGIYDRFDGPVMMTLIAPRPLLVINGDSDDRTPVPGLQLCAEAARRAYASAGADEKFQLLIQEKTGHAVTPVSQKIAIDWFVRWLRPS